MAPSNNSSSSSLSLSLSLSLLFISYLIWFTDVLLESVVYIALLIFVSTELSVSLSDISVLVLGCNVSSSESLFVWDSVKLLTKISSDIVFDIGIDIGGSLLIVAVNSSSSCLLRIDNASIELRILSNDGCCSESVLVIHSYLCCWKIG